MRQLPFRSECAGAAILMDAFEFFETEEDHEAVLREAARVLTTGGCLGLKVLMAVRCWPPSVRETERNVRER